jgi:hypothetical protein
VLTFDELMRRFTWRPIRGCPGRYVLRSGDARLSLGDLLGADASCAHCFRSHVARDEVWVVPLEDGGLISYRRPDGTFSHTLNTREGFTRKLTQLGIMLPLTERVE